MTVGGAALSSHNSELLIVIFVSMTLTVIVLLLLIYKMIQIRKRRLDADEWLNENQA
jgi:heme/copper-type cytochrome/quinol oxidase subunit 2